LHGVGSNRLVKAPTSADAEIKKVGALRKVAGAAPGNTMKKGGFIKELKNLAHCVNLLVLKKAKRYQQVN
jgi:hypothetical protein